ncbi:AfsR/SARP family transcriptional regulator [Lentzea albidocapillata]|uniref:DNA-binding transcriptional activator of the SARP family n=1 Tax=Lentzea albidocapillata TaxID=40571 RepID=A0A1W1ZLE1_9PSEU|nr:BTAD domain-containing putative transcriptional regulator [Lentzea albidocapillata]SMC49063.1 DNA-binding transcriptional activator of the SARP family [Lentzea albidocapillata]
MEFRILGPLEVRDRGAAVALGGSRQRAVLAALLLRANQTASVGYLAEAVWETPPATPASNLRTYVAGLRQRLGTARLSTRPGGYALAVQAGELDLLEFDRLSTIGDQALRNGAFTAAAESYDQALRLWRGTALEGHAAGPLLCAELARLEEQRLAVVERYVEVRLRLGHHADLVGDLRKLVAEQPLREELWAQLMLALYRCGRRADALNAYQQVYSVLDTELGVQPGQSLRELHSRLLSDDLAPQRVPTDQRPRQLPPEADHYTGRDAALNELFSLATRESAVLPIVTVTGCPGVGKTAFAIHAGHRLAESFPHGQLFADLRGADPRPHSPDDVLARFLRELGVPGVDVPGPGEERASMFRDRLAGRRVLVVLDNAASEDQVRPLLPGHAGCCVLITSRSRLTGLDTSKRIRLDALDPADSVRLLGKLVGDDVAGRKTAKRITALCGGLPLALRIVGMKLRSLPHLTADAVALRLADERHRLDELVGGDREVRASFLLSYASLDEAEQHAFRLLALLPGPSFPAWAAAAALEKDLFSTERLLDRLVEANLLECATGAAGRLRYHFHDLLHLFAEEKAQQDSPAPEREQSQRRVLNAYLHIVRQADIRLEFGGLTEFEPPALDLGAPGLVGDLVADALAWLDEEHTCLLEVIDRAVHIGLDELTCQFVASMCAYLELRSQWDALVHVVEPGLAAARRLGSAYWTAYALFARGLTAREQRDFALSEKLFRECLDVLPAAGDALLEVVTKLSVGVGHRLQGRLQAAATCFAECLDRLATLDNPQWLAYTLRELGVLHQYQENWHEAELCLRQAADEFGRLGDRRWRAASLLELGIVRLERGDRSDALEMLTTSQQAFLDLGDRRREAASWRNLAFLHLDSGDLNQAYACAVQSRELFALTLDEHGMACTEVCLGDIHLEMGERGQAQALIRRGLAMFETLGDPRWLSRARRSLEHATATSTAESTETVVTAR